MPQRLSQFVFVVVTIGLICLSVLVPIAIVIGSYTLAISGKAVGFRSRQHHYYGFGAVKGNELWRISTRLFPGIVYAKSEEYQFYRLNLETGEEIATQTTLHGPFCTKVWIGDQMYVNTGDELIRWDGSTITTLPQAPPMSQTIHAVPFEYEGRLTMVVEFETNRYRLVHLQNEEWIAGRELVMPTADHVWKTDSGSNLPALQLRDRLTEQPRGSGQVVLDIVSQGGQAHLLFKEYPTFSAYRVGFVFAESDGTASALQAENGTRPGWEPVLANHPEIGFESMVCDRDGLVFFTWQSMDDEFPDSSLGPSFLRRDQNGQIQTMQSSVERIGHIHLVSEGSDGKSYVILEDRYWGRLRIHRIRGTTIEPAHVELPGFADEYLRRWLCLLAGVIVAISTQYLAAILIADWIVARSPRRLLTDGQRTMLVASTSRRAFALLLDLVLALAVLIPIGVFHFKGRSSRVENYCDCLYAFEQFISGEFGLGPAPELNQALNRLAELFLPRSADTGSSGSIIVVVVGLLLLRSVCEGVYGITPGKVLCGIRTMRSDLRRCGVSRSLLRTLLLWLDLPMFITPVPAVISIVLSKRNQRLGDRLSDTVVVRTE